MQLSTPLSIILACIVAAAAIPLKLESEPDGISRTTLNPKVKKAMTGVNTQIPKMQKSLDDAEAGNAEAAERVRLAFGPQGVSQIPTIRENIQKIESGTVKVSSLAAGAVDKKHRNDESESIGGFTPIEKEREKETETLKVLPMEFGTSFFDKTRTDKQRTSILMHESAHALAHASDNHYEDGRMVPFGLKHADEHGTVVQEGGYASNHPYPDSEGTRITDDHLRQSFKDLRDSSPNMHMNADSYALFGAVCDQQMERRRKRALMEDDPVAYYLAKRGAASCKLPPDYFKKKAAAKAAKEKASSTSSPASKAELAKTTKKTAVGVQSGSQKTTKGGKPLAASKSTLGKATKSTLAKTSKSGLKGSKAKVTTSRGKQSNSKTSRLSSKVSNGALKGSKSKVPTTKASKALSRGKLSKSQTSKPSSKAAKGALKGSMSKSLKAKTTKAKTRTTTSKSKASKPLSKSLKSTRTKSVKANGSKASSKKAVKSKASGLGSSRAVPGKGTKAKVSSANRPSLKKGAAGASKKGGTGAIKQTKMSSTRSPASQEQRTSKQTSKLSSPKSSAAKSSKAKLTTQKVETALPKTVRTKASTPAQKATKASTAPKVAKALSKSVVNPPNTVALPKKKNGKP